MAATIPGVTPITDANGDPAGFSVLGLSADQNNTTLNGASFGASNIPRDAQVSSSLVTTPYDVSRGGFSGAQFSLRTFGSSNFIRRNNSLNLDAPVAPVDRPRGALTRPAVLQRLPRRTARRPDRVRQGVLQPVVSARPSRQRSAHPAQHRRGRPAGLRRRCRFRLAPAGDRRGAANSGEHRQRSAQRSVVRSGLAVRHHRPHAAELHQRHDDEPHAQRQLESPDARGQPRHRAAGAWRRPHELERRSAGASHVVREERAAQRDDAQPERESELRHPVPARSPMAASS